MCWMPLALAFLICLKYQSIAAASTVVYSTTSTGLNAILNKSSQKNDHLVVMVNEVYPVAVKKVRDVTGHLIGLQGVAPLMLDWLSRRYKFDYSVLDANVSSIDDRGPKLPGLFTYALRGSSPNMPNAQLIK
ncbi:hypothetical protein DAPPUDRAFT_263196 [Daphnia pulex]|uniref:Ionotropic glutamate receptor L-glutamate and glycine-binding domain-containing protein n=1 Tax=Daphnia pulex TaxID=6669 RepID=E9HPB2_DAPPU|nr:hypothetical protein DAPPUDRAFT_263196 [Daphnia pulex]|eukprot:EFX66412.1 hypothetical protein DAPPUDRAFT_263196 [Daphnia pulex]